jgi:hypothetical protein
MAQPAVLTTANLNSSFLAILPFTDRCTVLNQLSAVSERLLILVRSGPRHVAAPASVSVLQFQAPELNCSQSGLFESSHLAKHDRTQQSRRVAASALTLFHQWHHLVREGESPEWIDISD